VTQAFAALLLLACGDDSAPARNNAAASGGIGGVAGAGGLLSSGGAAGIGGGMAAGGVTSSGGTVSAGGLINGGGMANAGGSPGGGGTLGTGGDVAGTGGGPLGDGGSAGSDGGTPDTETPKLHVSGRFLQDTSGKNVLLHGWMQPTASWFNGSAPRALEAMARKNQVRGLAFCSVVPKASAPCREFAARLGIAALEINSDTIAGVGID